MSAKPAVKQIEIVPVKVDPILKSVGMVRSTAGGYYCFVTRTQGAKVLSTEMLSEPDESRMATENKLRLAIVREFLTSSDLK
jgi:hypothetical protein